MHAALLATYGASVAVFCVVAVFFFRFWVTQRERLFAFFAVAFLCFAAGFLIRILASIEENTPYVFLPRLLGFSLIILAIFDKNRRAHA